MTTFKEYMMNNELPDEGEGFENKFGNRGFGQQQSPLLPSRSRFPQPPQPPQPPKSHGHFGIKREEPEDKAVYMFIFAGAEGENWKTAFVDHKHEFEKQIKEEGTDNIDDPEDYDDPESVNDFVDEVQIQRDDAEEGEDDFSNGELWNFGFEINVYAGSMEEAKRLAVRKLRVNMPDLVTYQPVGEWWKEK